jgi:hypothetical protein
LQFEVIELEIKNEESEKAIDTNKEESQAQVLDANPYHPPRILTK